MMKLSYVVINFIMLSSILLMQGCGEEEKNTNNISIVATTGMIADAVRQIAGDSVELTGLMGPGVDPHLYKPTQGDISRLSKADLILYNGLHLEGKMQEILERLAERRAVVAVSQDIPRESLIMLNQPKGAPDPHIWFDVALWAEAVKTISQTLQAQDSARASYYQQRTEAYLTRLEALDREVKEEISRIPPRQRVLVTAHDAFSYFGRAYDIEVRGLQGISTLAEYGVQDISRLVDYISRRNIKAVFVESSVSPKALEAVVEGSRQRGHPLRIGGSLYSDALGAADTEAATYTGMVRHNVRTIVESLQ